MNILLRIVATIVISVVWHFTNTYINAYATAHSGAIAVDQFSDSATGYVDSITGIEFYKVLSSGTPTIVFLLVLIAIWWPVVRKILFKDSSVLAVFGAVSLGAIVCPDTAQAYYAKQDWAEVYNVLPNHSAFMIPATGDNKETQKQFESVSFLNEKKIGAKRIQIPHVVLKNSGVIDYYVPGALLVLLDRTPYVVTWTKVKTPGSEGNQEMCVETQDSVEVCFDTSIGANVLEEDAAKYLYWFGTEMVNSPDPNERKFPSVLYGKSLPNVMNTRVFSRIHAAYFAEFSQYPFAEMMKKKSEILKTVEKQMIEEYKKMGITIEYVGIASQFRFNDKIQEGINGVLSAEYQQRAANAKLEAAKVDRYIAETQIMLNQSEPYTKWDGKTFPNVPSVWVGSDSVIGWIKNLFTSSKQ